MIFGLNYNGTQIPPGVKRKFAARVRVEHEGKRTWAVLQGVGQSPAERDAMLLQANNGHRRLHVEERMTLAGVWFGIYVY